MLCDLKSPINYTMPGSKINCLSMIATRAPKFEILGAQNKMR